jgi:hypothetical protein
LTSFPYLLPFASFPSFPSFAYFASFSAFVSLVSLDVAARCDTMAGTPDQVPASNREPN